MTTVAPSRLQVYQDDALAFLQDIGAGLWSWQQDILREALQRRSGRFLYRFVGISEPRGNGKSFKGACIGVWRLFTGPAGQDVISVALDEDGARITFGYATQLIERSPLLSPGARILRREIVLDTGRTADGLPRPPSLWTVETREHTSTRGRHPTLILYDELGWTRDEELFAALSAAQAPVDDPLFVVTSTVGASRSGPLWELKRLAEEGGRAVYFFHTTENLSPLVTPQFLEQQRRLLHPLRYRREHENTWSEGADSFLSHELLEEAYEEGWKPQRERQEGTYYAFVDLGLVHDATVIAVAHRREDGKAVLDALRTFRGSRSQPVRVNTVVDTVARLSEAFRLELVRVESPEGGEAVVQALHEKGVRAEVLRPTVKTQQEAWGNLLSLFQNMQLVLFRHGELGRELLNLQIKNTPTGFRVFDPGGIHQDHALALAGAALLASEGGGSQFVDMAEWDRLAGHVPELGVLDPGAHLVAAVDRADAGDEYSLVAVTRHWLRERQQDVAVRAAHKLDRRGAEQLLRELKPIHITYTSGVGLEPLMQQLRVDGLWTEPFPSAEMAEAELSLRDRIIAGSVVHGGDGELRTSIAAAVLDTAGSTPKMVSRGRGDVSLLRALTMSVSRAMYLTLRGGPQRD